MSKMSRRAFLQRTAVAAAASSATLTKGVIAAERDSSPKATLIDLTKCNGCAGEKIPACVSACRVKNKARFPQPQQPIPDYWPRKGYEDWSDKQHVTNRLTPYNWLYVQPVKVDGKEVFVPRRCMHCENPPCAQICPFSAYTIHQDSAVVVDPDVCFGGAKCRDVCPWGVPARQAGVGLYMKLVPQLGGGGVMFKCDMCHDLIEQGQTPACVAACPQKAMQFGDKAAMKQLAIEKARAINGYTYGITENGGTATFYVSSVSFDAINQAMHSQGVIDGKPGRSGMPAGIGNRLKEFDGWGSAMLLAPVATLVAAGAAAYKSMKTDDDLD